MKNKLSDLRNHLFEALERLNDKDDPMPVDRANAIAAVSREIISSAKVELKAIEVLGSETTESPFFDGKVQPKLNQPSRSALPQ